MHNPVESACVKRNVVVFPVSYLADGSGVTEERVLMKRASGVVGHQLAPRREAWRSISSPIARPPQMHKVVVLPVEGAAARPSRLVVLVETEPEMRFSEEI